MKGSFVAAIVVAGCVLSACGDSEDARAPAVKVANTQDAFVAKADAICKVANDKEKQLGASGAGWIWGPQYDDISFLQPFTDAGRVAARDLKKLSAPAESRRFLDPMVVALDRMVKALDRHVAALEAGKRESRAVNEYLSGYSDLVASAGPLGVSECQDVLL